MNEQKIYEWLLTMFQSMDDFPKHLKWLNRFLTRIFVVLYLVGAIYCGIWRSHFILHYIGIPFFSTIVMSVFRRIVHRPRPYLQYGIVPILDKENAYDAMPSRHTYSAMIISMMIFRLFPAFGIVCMIMTFILGMIRVIGGIHYFSDIVVAMLLGFIVGWL